MTDIIFYAQFISSGYGVTGLAVNTDVYSINKSDGTSALEVATGSATEIGGGLYQYRYADADLLTYDYLANFAVTGSSVDQQQIGAIRWDDSHDTIWDEPLTKAAHDVAQSSGKRLRLLEDVIIVDGTAVTGTVNTITLNGDASTSDGAYDPAIVYLIAGTGAGQSRGIYQYTGATKVAVVDRNWKTIPDGTSEYIIGSWPGREHVNEGLAQTGTSTSITLNALASSNDNAYIGQIVFLRSGTGEDQARIVETYNGTTKVATIIDTWDVVPDGTTGYVMLPYPGHTHVVRMEQAGLADFFDTDSGKVSGDAIEGSVVKEIGDSVAAATDPWATEVPGDYPLPQAGAVLGRITSGRIETVSPTAQSGLVEIFEGDSYTGNRKLTWTDTNDSWLVPSLLSGTVQVAIAGVTTYTGLVLLSTGTNKSVGLELSISDTTGYPLNKIFDFQARFLSNDGVDQYTLVAGNWTYKAKF